MLERRKLVICQTELVSGSLVLEGFFFFKSRAQLKGEKRGKTMACITHKSSFP